MSIRLMAFLISQLFLVPAIAASNAGVITSLSGQAEIFTRPSDNAEGPKTKSEI
ncbi:MAG: hypothetical protein R2827_10070 [Bdellovibrionales bacterium]